MPRNLTPLHLRCEWGECPSMQLGPGTGYREVWWEVGGGEIEFEPTHFMACPLPPAEKEPS